MGDNNREITLNTNETEIDNKRSEYVDFKGNNNEHSDRFFDDVYNSNYQVINRNNGHFETKITYLSSGLIVLSLTLIAGRFTHNKLLFVLGVIFAVLTLIINMCSYVYGNALLKDDAEKFLRLKNERHVNLNHRKQIVRKTVLRTYGKLTCINNITLSSLILGIFFLSIFVISNVMQPTLPAPTEASQPTTTITETPTPPIVVTK